MRTCRFEDEKGRHLLNRLRVCRRALVLAWLLVGAAMAHAQTGAPSELAQQAYEKIVEARGNARSERYLEALNQLGQAVSLAEQAGSRLPLALALHNMAEVRLLKGEPLDALKDFHRVLGVYTELGHRSGVKLARDRIDMLSRLFRKPRTPAAPVAEGPAPAASSPAGDPGEVSAVAPVEPPRTEEADRLARIDQAVERIRRRQRGEETPEPSPVEGVQVTHTEPWEEPDNPREWAYVESLRRKIGGNARYPEYAKRTRQEGAVDVVFAVRENGEVEGIKLSRSSGFIVLDVEALRNVRETAPFGPIPRSVPDNSLTVRLTLNYGLPDPPAVAP